MSLAVAALLTGLLSNVILKDEAQFQAGQTDTLVFKHCPPGTC